jgi:hypothetical protein
MKIELCGETAKQAQMLKLLQFGTVMIFVDSRHPDVLVPDYLKDDCQLRLNFDYAYDIEDFRILPDRIEASLSFNHKNFYCVLPYDALYLMLSHRIRHGALFSQSVPDEMVDFFVKEAKISHLTSKSPLAEETDTLEEPQSFEFEEVTEVRKGHLRLVKS